jgi:hypothetical protein
MLPLSSHEDLELDRKRRYTLGCGKENLSSNSETQRNLAPMTVMVRPEKRGISPGSLLKRDLPNDCGSKWGFVTIAIFGPMIFGLGEQARAGLSC